MSKTIHLPESEDVGKFLTSLFGLEAAVTESHADDFATHALAEYADDGGDVRGIIACDLPAAAKLGAALTQIPLGSVEDSIDAGSLPGNVTENLSEVFNIAVNLFPESHNYRLAVCGVTFGEDAIGKTDVLAGADGRHFQVDVQRYGQGKMMFATS